MKRLVYLLVLSVILIGLDGCKALGIGKQCYTCVTEALGKSTTKVTQEVCGYDEMKAYQKENTKSVGGVFFSTLCTEK